MGSRSVLLVVAVVVVLSLTSVTWAQTEPNTFSVNWTNTPLSDVLGSLKKNFGLNYALPAEFATAPVSVNVWNATPEVVLQAAVTRAGLQAESRNGTWVISQPEKAKAQGGEGATAFAQFPGLGPVGGMVPGMPMPANPTSVPGLGMPGPGGGFGSPPGRGTRSSTRTGATATTASKPLHFIVIPLYRASPELIGYAVQADDVIYDTTGQNNSQGGGQNGSSGLGQNGSSGYGNNSSSGLGNSGGLGGTSRGTNSSSRSTSSRGY